MLTYAHVCSRMLTYADGRRLTYAAVCSRMWTDGDTYGGEVEAAASVCYRGDRGDARDTHVCSYMLTYAHVLTHSAYADVCGRTRTYSDVWHRTYVDVLGRILTYGTARTGDAPHIYIYIYIYIGLYRESLTHGDRDAHPYFLFW
jgi:hypothetical protein